MKHLTTALLGACLLLSAWCWAGMALASDRAGARILIFTRTADFRHDSIPVTVRTLTELARSQGLAADHSEAASDFNDAQLRHYRAVVFAHTTGDVLDPAQQAALKRFIQHGGGFMGLHAAADTEYDWPWYGQLVGAWFRRHGPGLEQARIALYAADGERRTLWDVTDELYQYRSPPPADARVLARIERRAPGDDGPVGKAGAIGWCRQFDGGRTWYTGLGHDPALYLDPVFRTQLAQGLAWVSGASPHC